MTTTLHCRELLIDGVGVADVRVGIDDGVFSWFEPGRPPQPGDLELGTVLPGSGNAHSHAFHRMLRGRTHGDGGDFWRWRTAMYDVANILDPDLYRELAVAVFAEMLTAGWTAVGEFHYVHHRPDGSPYPDSNAVGLALAEAAVQTGIRLTLLDTCYLTGAPGEPLSPEQRRFGDASPDAFLERWHRLADAAAPGVTVGAAIHSVRAVPPAAIRTIVTGLPADTPLHVHLSEQPLENRQSLASYGRTPTAVLAEVGALSPRLTVVHATHLTEDDIDTLGDAGVTAAFCPSTEADLGDGIGPARELVDAGARLALGSDQNAVIDPFLEVRGLEAGERLRSGSRGRFTPAELDEARSVSGYRTLGIRGGARIGASADLIEVDHRSVRTVGTPIEQLQLVATASDVRHVLVGGDVVASHGLLADGRGPSALLEAAIAAVDQALPSREGRA